MRGALWRPMPPAVVAWCFVPVYVVAADWWLIRHGHPTMSALARGHVFSTSITAGLLTAHLLRQWNRDPLHLFAVRFIRIKLRSV